MLQRLGWAAIVLVIATTTVLGAENTPTAEELLQSVEVLSPDNKELTNFRLTADFPLKLEDCPFVLQVEWSREKGAALRMTSAENRAPCMLFADQQAMLLNTRKETVVIADGIIPIFKFGIAGTALEFRSRYAKAGDDATNVRIDLHSIFAGSATGRVKKEGKTWKLTWRSSDGSALFESTFADQAGYPLRSVICRAKGDEAITQFALRNIYINDQEHQPAIRIPALAAAPEGVKLERLKDLDSLDSEIKFSAAYQDIVTANSFYRLMQLSRLLHPERDSGEASFKEHFPGLDPAKFPQQQQEFFRKVEATAQAETELAKNPLIEPAEAAADPNRPATAALLAGFPQLDPDNEKLTTLEFILETKIPFEIPMAVKYAWHKEEGCRMLLQAGEERTPVLYVNQGKGLIFDPTKSSIYLLAEATPYVQITADEKNFNVGFGVGTDKNATKINLEGFVKELGTATPVREGDRWQLSAPSKSGESKVIALFADEPGFPLVRCELRNAESNELLLAFRDIHTNRELTGWADFPAAEKLPAGLKVIPLEAKTPGGGVNWITTWLRAVTSHVAIRKLDWRSEQDDVNWEEAGNTSRAFGPRLRKLVEGPPPADEAPMFALPEEQKEEPRAANATEPDAPAVR